MDDIQDIVNEILDGEQEASNQEVDEAIGQVVSGAVKVAAPLVKKAVTSRAAKDAAKSVATTAAERAGKTLVAKASEKLQRKKGDKQMDNANVNEAELGVVNAKSEEDKDLYKDATGKGAKIDTDKGTEGKSGKNKASIAGKSPGSSTIERPKASGTPKERLEDVMGSLFDGEDLSESFKEKTSIVFEAAINDRVAAIEEEITEQYEKVLAEHLEEVTEDLATKLDEYLNYVVEHWLEQNELAIEQGVRSDIAEDFIVGLKGLFESCWIDVPESKVDVVSEIAEENEELQDALNVLAEDNVELTSELLASECALVFATECRDLTDMEVEKFASLVEGIEFDDVEQYTEKVSVIKENYFNEGSVSENSSFEEDSLSLNESNEYTSTGGVMDSYVSAIQRQTRNQ